MQIYTNDDIQEILNELNENEVLKNSFLKEMESSTNENDKTAIIYCINDGYYESFERFDSDVCEQFIKIYERITNENKLIKKIEKDGSVIFIIKTHGEDDYWYWVVDKTYVDNYAGTDEGFINDSMNGSLGCSCASFSTLEEAEKNALS